MSKRPVVLALPDTNQMILGIESEIFDKFYPNSGDYKIIPTITSVEFARKIVHAELDFINKPNAQVSKINIDWRHTMTIKVDELSDLSLLAGERRQLLEIINADKHHVTYSLNGRPCGEHLGVTGYENDKDVIAILNHALGVRVNCIEVILRSSGVKL